MNKQDLLNELSTKFHKLGRVAPVDLSPTDTTIRDEEGVKWYIAGIYEKADNRLIRKNIPFYVESEGEAGEAAFYAEKLPAETLSTPTITPFKDLVIAEIEKNITAGIILKGTVDSANEDEKFAVVTAYQLVVDEVVAKKYFIYSDTTDKLHFKPMKDI